MIISASRRTDIPAFYSEWLMGRIREGFCHVPNPFNANQVSRVSLKPEDVDAIVFWSKNPAPLLPHLDELEQRGFRYYFQFTLNDYPTALEPEIPSLDERVSTFLQLAERVGADRVIWRYDPIVVSNLTDADFHREKFSALADRLNGVTRRVMVSLCDFYHKTDTRLAPLELDGCTFDKSAAFSSKTFNLLAHLAQTAREHQIEILSCAEERDYNDVGIGRGMCVDADLIRRLWRIQVSATKDPNQRKHCQCAVSKDIGVNDTCVHGCLYCYSTRSMVVAEGRHAKHDPNSPSLWGNTQAISGFPAHKARQARLFGNDQ